MTTVSSTARTRDDSCATCASACSPGASRLTKEESAGGELVELVWVGSEPEASVITSLLRANEIPCAESASLAPVLGIGTGGGVSIQVRASDLERAQALLG